MKRTVVIGASPNPARYAHKAVQELVANGHETFAVGLRSGEISGVKIQTDKPTISDIDTVTLYVGPQNQHAWKDYILQLNPRRVIFNPGTENEVLIKKLLANGIEVEQACTLVLLSIGNY